VQNVKYFIFIGGFIFVQNVKYFYFYWGFIFVQNNLPRRLSEGVEVYLCSFFSLGARGELVVKAALRPPLPTGTHFMGCWVGKIRLCRDSIPGPYSL